MMAEKGTDYGQQIVILLFCIISITIAFGLALGLWPIQAHAFGHTSSIRHSFCLMDWFLHLIRDCLVTPKTFVAITAPACLTGRSPSWIEGFVAQLMITFLPWYWAEYFPVSRTLVNEGEGSGLAPAQLLHLKCDL